MEDIRKLLNDSPFFQYLASSELDRLARIATPRKFSAGESLFTEGGATDEAHLVLEGVVALSLESGGGRREVVRQLKPGAVVGLGTFLGTVESVSAHAIHDLKTLALSRQALATLYEESPELRRQLVTRAGLIRNARKILQLLKETAFFREMSPVLIRWLLDSATLVPMDEGTIIFREGDEGDAFYLLLKGQVRIYKEGSRAETLGTLYPGNCLGELALLEACPRSATARVEKDAELLIVNRQKFQQLLDVSAPFRRAISATVNERSSATQIEGTRAELLLLCNRTPLPSSELALSVARSLWRQYSAPTLIVFCHGSASKTRGTPRELSPGVSGLELPMGADLRGRLRSILSSGGFHYVLFHTESSKEEEAFRIAGALSAEALYFVDDPSLPFPYEDVVAGLMHYGVLVERTRVAPARAVSRRGMVKLYRAGSDSRAGVLHPAGIDRLVRSLTRRMVGVALGGGGAWGFGHCALLDALQKLRIPVDFVSGSSFGSIVGAFYVSMGLAGLERLQKMGVAITASAMLAALSSRSIEIFIERNIPERNLEDLEYPFLPVAVNILNGAECVFRSGSIGAAVRASGAFPGVFAPSWIKGVKYVDGAILNNVPASILAEAGADYIISSNVIPVPRVLRGLEDKKLSVDYLTKRFSPWARIEDTIRSFYMLLKAAGERQAECSNFLFEPDLIRFFLSDFTKSRDIVAAASESLLPLHGELQESYRAFCFGDRKRVPGQVGATHAA